MTVGTFAYKILELTEISTRTESCLIECVEKQNDRKSRWKLIFGFLNFVFEYQNIEKKSNIKISKKNRILKYRKKTSNI